VFSFSHLRRRYVEVCLLGALLAACQDSSTDPLALILSDDTWSALAADGHLPSVEALVTQSGLQGTVTESAARWSSSWELPLDAGREVRRAAYEQVSAPLADALSAEAVAEHVAALGEVLAAADALTFGQASSGLAISFEAATLRHREAVAALADGRRGEALSQTLQGSDLLREVGPEGVARMLLARAEGELARVSAQGAPASDEATTRVERGERLIRGARQALDEGDYLRAIQRAFYACQVLGVRASI
jgi:hypothetical protein